MTGINSVLWIVGSYVVVVALIFIVINFLTKGFLSQYLKVKMSRGKHTLIKCNDVTDTYYKAGKIDSKRNLIIKDRFKKIHTLTGLSIEYVRRELGVNLIEVDIVKDNVIKRDFSLAKSYDTTVYDEMLQRGIMLPKLNDNPILENLLKLVAFGTFIGVCVILYLLVTAEPISCVATVSNLAPVVNI